MSDLVPFDYLGHQVRTIQLDEDPWFVAADVCRVLDLRDTSSALKMVDTEDKDSLRRSDTPHFFQGIAAQVQSITVVNEAGVYSLIFQSNKPSAKKFKRWITHDVLPQIRKTGQYMAQPQSTLDVLAQAVAELQRVERTALEATRAAEETRVEVRAIEARVDVLEDHRDWLTAGGYLRTQNLRWPDQKVNKLGKVARIVGRTMGLEPGRHPHPRWIEVNTWPVDVWDLALAEMTH